MKKPTLYLYLCKRMKKKLINSTIVLTLIGVLLGGFYVIGNKAVRSKGYPGIVAYLTGATSNYTNGLNVIPERIYLELTEDDIARFQKQRTRAIKEGIMLNIGDNYTEANLTCKDIQTPIDIRLKGHMTDHLQENKWSFRIKSKTPILGMTRFTLQHPGTRNYIYEWMFHQWCKSKGIIALKYNFVEVFVNKVSWGIYALEEHFGQELLAHNDRPKGAIMRFDPTLYWQGRLREKEGLTYDGNYNQFLGSHVDTYAEGSVLKDSLLKYTFEKGAFLLESFRRHKLKAHEVFDIDLMAKYLAIIDVVGGYHSLDWSDVKFYYNSLSKKLEPVSYESFGVRHIKSIAGQGRFMERPPLNDFHKTLFSDPVFFERYIQMLSDIADPEDFNAFIESQASGLRHNQAILAKSYPFKPFTNNVYLKNIKLINKVLNHPAALKVNLNKSSKTKINLAVRNVSNLPLEIISLSYKDDDIMIHEIIEPLLSHGMPKAQLIEVINPLDKVLNPKKIRINYRILGGKTYKEPIIPFKFDFEGFQNENDTLKTLLLEKSDSLNLEQK